MRLGLLLLATSCTTVEANGGANAGQSSSRSLSGLSLIAEQASGQRLEIMTEAGAFNRAAAVLISGGRVWRTTDVQCEGFRAALDAFQALPPLKPGPRLLLPDAAADTPMPPYRVHAEAWTFRTQLNAPDWSAMETEMRGSQGPYPAWADETVRAIKACGPPDPQGREGGHEGYAALYARHVLRS